MLHLLDDAFFDVDVSHLNSIIIYDLSAANYHTVLRALHHLIKIHFDYNLVSFFCCRKKKFDSRLKKCRIRRATIFDASVS